VLDAFEHAFATLLLFRGGLNGELTGAQMRGVGVLHATGVLLVQHGPLGLHLALGGGALLVRLLDRGGAERGRLLGSGATGLLGIRLRLGDEVLGRRTRLGPSAFAL